MKHPFVFKTQPTGATMFPPRKRNPGFTLIELLTVMGIIAMMSVIGLISYSNMARGSAFLAMRKNIEGSVMLARQHASLLNRPVHLLLTAYGRVETKTTEDAEGNKISQSYQEAHYEIVTVYEGGRVTSSSVTPPPRVGIPPLANEKGFYDVYAEPYWFEQQNIGASVLGGKEFYIYNISQGTRAKIERVALGYDQAEVDKNADPETPPAPVNQIAYPRKALWFSTVDENNNPVSIFNAGDDYGIELSQPYRLSRGFEFDGMQTQAAPNNPDYKVRRITFLPDGRMTSSTAPNFKIKEFVGSKGLQVTVMPSGFTKIEDYK